LLYYPIIINNIEGYLSEDKEATIEEDPENVSQLPHYLLSRRDFISGVLIGVTSSTTIGYITQLD
jgi:hypothetical protein